MRYPKHSHTLNSHKKCCLYRDIFNYGPRHLLLSLTSELPVLIRLLDQVIRTMLCRLLLGALGRHLSLSASSLGRHSARIPAATAELGLVMLVLSMITTPTMIVSNNFCILRECLVPHGRFRFCRAVSLGITDALPKDALCASHMIFTFVCDVSAILRLIPPPWGMGIHGRPCMNLDITREPICLLELIVLVDAMTINMLFFLAPSRTGGKALSVI